MEHFKLYFFAAILRVLSLIATHTPAETGRQLEEEVFARFPFMLAYTEELAYYGLDGLTLDQAERCWAGWLEQWEESAAFLPIRALRSAANLDYATLLLLFVIGLNEEDARFSNLFRALQGGPEGDHPGPSLALLSTLDSWPGSFASGADGFSEMKRALNRLHELNLLEISNPTAPRLDWVYRPLGILWDALHGDLTPFDQPVTISTWCRAVPMLMAPRLQDLVLPETFLAALSRIPALVTQGELQTIVLRGPQHNDRQLVLQALAGLLGLGSLMMDEFAPFSEEHWKIVGSLAILTGCMPIISFELAPGETAQLPNLSGYSGPIGVVAGRQGGLIGPRAERLLALNLDLPDLPSRRRLWKAALTGWPCSPDVIPTAASLRLTRGSIRRAARLAHTAASLSGHSELTPDDIQQAIRLLNRQSLETLAHRLDNHGSLADLAVNEETRLELDSLLSRIRHRELLAGSVGSSLRDQINPGVRALFSGPSGSGKTLAARLLAAELNLDIYRIDLSSVVNKYIGETEKNLSRVFSRAEELDVVLLLDEGDALLTNRTAVSSSNDRYANLETNYLLQRIESFHGILIVTTNASERIDQAFQRRMDVIIEFHLPDPAERWEIWVSHLPEYHQVSAPFLTEVVGRCALSGAQIRNAVLHASLLALQAEGAVNDAWLFQALQREYRKAGANCPVKFQPPAASLPILPSRPASQPVLPGADHQELD